MALVQLFELILDQCNSSRRLMVTAFCIDSGWPLGDPQPFNFHMFGVITDLIVLSFYFDSLVFLCCAVQALQLLPFFAPSFCLLCLVSPAPDCSHLCYTNRPLLDLCLTLSCWFLVCFSIWFFFALPCPVFCLVFFSFIHSWIVCSWSPVTSLPPYTPNNWCAVMFWHVISVFTASDRRQGRPRGLGAQKPLCPWCPWWPSNCLSPNHFVGQKCVNLPVTKNTCVVVCFTFLF